MDENQIKSVASNLRAGEVGILPTDTIYGIVASVKNENSIERVYSLTGRPSSKPFIILVADYEQLKIVGIKLTDMQIHALKQLWPGPISAILPVKPDNQQYLHRGMNSLAVRLPEPDWLRKLLRLSGPIIATSANLSGEPTPDKLSDIKEQIPGLDFYIEGKVGDVPSKLVHISPEGKQVWISRK